MRLDTVVLQEEHYKEIKKKYPDLSWQDYKAIVDAPWEFIRETMSSGELYDFRFMHLGVFGVSPVRAKFLFVHNTLGKASKKKERLDKMRENYEKRFDPKEYHKLLHRELPLQDILQARFEKAAYEKAYKGADRLQDKSNGQDLL